MNTNYDNEATRYNATDDETTRLENATNVKQPDISNKKSEEKTAKKGGWKRAAAGAASGLLVGAVAPTLMGMKSADTTDTGQEDNGNRHNELSNPEWVDDQVQVATSVSDDMSFGEAFAAARAEVGSGGCFEWRGNIYSTYTAEEWNAMSAEERAEWGNHFSWNHIDHSSSSVAQHATTADDDIKVISVNHEDTADEIAQVETDPEYSSEPLANVEIIGVDQDPETGAYVGGMSIDGQDVILIDVDGNMVFDYMGADTNGDGQIEQGEIVDIQEQGITVNDLGGLNSPMGDMMASNDTPDDTPDVYEG